MRRQVHTPASAGCRFGGNIARVHFLLCWGTPMWSVCGSPCQGLAVEPAVRETLLSPKVQGRCRRRLTNRGAESAGAESSCFLPLQGPQPKLGEPWVFPDSGRSGPDVPGDQDKGGTRQGPTARRLLPGATPSTQGAQTRPRAAAGSARGWQGPDDAGLSLHPGQDGACSTRPDGPGQGCV